jgi:predicted acylesterase/phospholipase RssA/CRP-like cAMP-binding protein
LAGETVLRQGDEADAMYLVTSGRLELVQETAAGAVVTGTVGQRGTVGEIGVLTGEAHPVSARAVRDSELMVVDRALVLSLVQESRVFSAALLNLLGGLLAEMEGTRAALTTKRGVFALVPVDDGARTDWLCEELLAQFRQWGEAAVLEAPASSGSEQDEETAAARQLGQLEERHDLVMIKGSPVMLADRWTRFCTRQADRILAVVGRDRPPGALDLRALHGCDVVFSAPGIAPHVQRQWLDALQPRAHHRVGDAGAVSVLARRITGRSVGLVLSGGGARGLAHVGVLQALLESHISIDRVGGTSMGAFVGSMFANGRSPAEITHLFHRELVERRPFNDYTLPVVSLARGHRARGMMDRLFGDVAIEDLLLDFFCVTADLVSGHEVVHRRGEVWLHVGASMSIPGWAPPVRVGDQVLVDGGVLNNFPIDVMGAMDEGPIIGVDAMGMSRGGDLSEPTSGQINRRLPNIGETLAGAATLGSRRRAEDNMRQAALVIRPPVGVAGLMEFSKLERLVEVGRESALEALERDGAKLLA